MNRKLKINICVANRTVDYQLPVPLPLGQYVQIVLQDQSVVSIGYSNNPIMSEFSRYGFSGVVLKPYSISMK